MDTLSLYTNTPNMNVNAAAKHFFKQNLNNGPIFQGLEIVLENIFDKTN